MAIKMKMPQNLFLALCFVGVLDLVLLLPTSLVPRRNAPFEEDGGF